MVRAAYALGGLGSGLCDTKEDLEKTVNHVRLVLYIFDSDTEDREVTC